MLRITLLSGSYHEVDGSIVAFRTAAVEAMKLGLAKASPMLEPYTRVEIETPSPYLGDIIGNINSRRGKVVNIEMRADMRTIECHVPLAEIFNYSLPALALTGAPASAAWKCAMSK
ncbi:hypothetical protein MASR1M12_22290 [Erysipelotrichia bacterium]